MATLCQNFPENHRLYLEKLHQSAKQLLKKAAEIKIFQMPTCHILYLANFCRL